MLPGGRAVGRVLGSGGWRGTELLSGGSGVAGTLERISSLSHSQRYQAVPVNS